ncbi:MAG: histidine kinase N-terminal 7TM domain-containing protein [Acutalibacteraceae bacterium]
MTDRRKKEFLTSGIVVLAVILAYSFRLVGRGDFYPTLFSYLRSFIYIGLYAAWGLSVRQRIVQRQVGRYLTAVSVLIILWFTFRSAKYFIFWQPDAMRYLWYLFYLPMLFVPMLALLIAISLGKPDSYRLPRATAALWLVSGTLLALVLTNDLHQFVFTFPVDAAVWSDTNHGYGFGYFSVIGWQVACAVAALVVMIFKCRMKNGRRHLWPAIPMAVSLSYLALSYSGVQWVKAALGDVTSFQSFMYMLCFEACIACGYIHSNSRYADLFASSVGTSAEITDRNFNIRYAALNTEAIPKYDMKKALQSPVTRKNGLTVHAMPISGGYAVWTEDMSALLAIKAESESLAEELGERNDLLRYEYKREAKHRKVEEQNRLYDLLQSATQRQIDRISELTGEYQKKSKSAPERAKVLLAEIAVLCSYIKRRKHLTLLTDRDYEVSVGELERAFSESLQTLKLLDVRSTLYIDPAVSMLSGKAAAAVFDFYETAIETDLESLKSIQVSLADVGYLRLSLNVQCEANLSALADKSSTQYETEDGYQHIVFCPEGGAAK